MATKHDQLMKELLATFPDQFLRLTVPEIAERIDLSTVAFEPEEHYPGNPSGRERRADLVGRATARLDTGDSEKEVEEAMLHVEIELEYRARTAPRLLSYNQGLSLKYARVVHTIVLYLRGGPPGPQRGIYEEQSLGERVLTFRYHSFGLSRAPAAEYLARPEPLAWALAALMWPMKGQSRPQLGLACGRRIAGARELTRAQRDLLFECVLRYASLQDPQAREFDKILAETDDEEVRNMATSMIEWWRKQGREEGRTEGQRDLVLQLIENRFGSPSEGVRHRVSAIKSAEELARLAAKVYQVHSLEDLELA